MKKNYLLLSAVFLLTLIAPSVFANNSPFPPTIASPGWGVNLDVGNGVYFDSNTENASWTYVYIEKDGAFWWGKWVKHEKSEVSEGRGDWFADYPFPEGKYKWWARGWNESGESGYGPWTESYYFQVGRSIAGNVANQYEGIVQCRWYKVKGATYEVWVNRDGVYDQNWSITSTVAGSGGRLFEFGEDVDNAFTSIVTNIPVLRFGQVNNVWVRANGGPWSSVMTVEGKPWVIPPDTANGKTFDAGFTNPAEGEKLWVRFWVEDTTNGGVVVYDKWTLVDIDYRKNGGVTINEIDRSRPYDVWVQMWSSLWGYTAWSDVTYVDLPSP